MKISVQELLIVLVIVVLIFGPTQIPKISKMMGKSIRNFKKGMEEETEPVSGEDTDGEKE